MDITPRNTGERRLVDSYGEGRFRVAGELFEGSLLLLPQGVLPWPVTRLEEALPEALAPVMEAAEEIDLLLLGCGARMGPPPAALRKALGELGIALEPMDTGAAARTFNVLTLEERRVAAALIAVD